MIHHNYHGKLIVIEGPDGAGKTTLVKALAPLLDKDTKKTVVTTQEPWSDGVVGKLIRSALTKNVSFPEDTLALLFAADRIDHIHKVIGPSLEAGHIVLCDRYVASNLAYQGRSFGESWISIINEGATEPDLTVIIDVPFTVARTRNKKLNGRDELFDGDDTQKRINDWYREYKQGNPKVAHIDGDQSLAETVCEAKREILERLFGRYP